MGSPDTVQPPRLVRLAFRMHLPIQPQWRPWALRQLEWRYGAHPSEEDRDIVVPPYINPLTPWLDASTSVGGRFPRRSLSIRKADDQYAIGMRADGSPIPRRPAIVDPTAFFERLPQALWPWLPAAVIATLVGVVVATVVLALALV